ncbi:hypothetical Protein YC6258_01308 [Gynuella sunshinyii YC6258]|uniref:Uncharacterized protein n=1 Tax=Gynuella sunshinyii YC6258 TaxID=1445510 RepID=A0A0C5VGM9_9GAMM|nr:hypothetical Protein YC6258_01308 [Gynuella sunshinyii YC6258]
MRHIGGKLFSGSLIDIFSTVIASFCFALSARCTDIYMKKALLAVSIEQL